MQQFEFILKNDKVKGYRVLALSLFALNVFIFFYFLFFDQYRLQALAAFGLLALYLAIQFFIKKEHSFIIDSYALFILAGCWIMMKFVLPAVLMILLGVLYALAIQPLKIVFNQQNIIKKNFPEKSFEWSEVSNVLLKDDILTMDFENNHILQKEIETSAGISEKDFNFFAKQQMLSPQSAIA